MGVRAWRRAFSIAMLLTPGATLLAQTRAWTVTPSIGVRGTYTDNASLVAAPAHGEFVTDISPSVGIHTTGRRLSVNANYTADVLFYAKDRKQDRIANTLNGTAKLEAIDQFFFVDGQANVSQSYLSPFAPRPTDLATTTPNRLETRTFSLSPYVRSQTPGGYSYEVRNRNTWTSTDNATLAKIHTNEWSANLASPISVFGWSVDADKQRTDFEDSVGRPERESSIARGHVYFQPQSSLRLSASAGRESNNFIAEETRSNSTYGYGVLWRPTPRTSTQFDWERRFFGVSKQASFEHRTRLTAWNASYTKSVSNSQQEVLRLPPGNTVLLLDQIFQARIPDPVQRVQAIVDFLRTTGTPLFLANSLSFFTEQVFLQERLQGSFAILGARNSIVFTAFRSRSTALSEPVPGVPSEIFLTAGSRIKQRGFGTSVNHRLTGFTSLGASANRTFNEQEGTGVESRNDFLSFSLSHTVSPKTNTFAGVSYTHFQSPGSPGSNARSAFAGLVHRF